MDHAQHHLSADISTRISHELVNEIEAHLNNHDASYAPILNELIKDCHQSDIGELVSYLSKSARAVFFTMVDEKIAPDILTYLPESLHDEILEILPPEQLSRYLRMMESDDALAIIEQIDRSDREAILALLPEANSLIYRKLLSYPDDSAARIMRREAVIIPADWSVGDVIDYMRDRQNYLPEDFHNIMIVDNKHQPVGLLPASRLMRAARNEKIQEIMQENQHLIPTDMDKEDVAQLFRKYGLIESPVIDESRRLVGVITIDDVLDVIDEEHSEDLLKLGGVKEDDFYADIGETAKSRFSWLFVNLLTAVIASIAIGLFEDVLAQIVALAILMPIVASMGGNAATQSMTVTIRALALNQISRHTLGRIIFKESIVGWINGFIFAGFAFIMAYFWFGSLFLGSIIAAAMLINLIIAALCGVLVPIILNYLKFDPAVSSGVFVTTITDVVGFIAFLGLASLYLFY